MLKSTCCLGKHEKGMLKYTNVVETSYGKMIKSILGKNSKSDCFALPRLFNFYLLYIIQCLFSITLFFMRAQPLRGPGVGTACPPPLKPRLTFLWTRDNKERIDLKLHYLLTITFYTNEYQKFIKGGY